MKSKAEKQIKTLINTVSKTSSKEWEEIKKTMNKHLEILKIYFDKD